MTHPCATPKVWVILNDRGVSQNFVKLFFILYLGNDHARQQTCCSLDIVKVGLLVYPAADGRVFNMAANARNNALFDLAPIRKAQWYLE